MWRLIDDCENNNHIICGSSQSAETNKELESHGIVSLHAYTIRELVEFTISEGRIRLIKMRNPWGHKEWDGEWSDKSSKWNDKLRK